MNVKIAVAYHKKAEKIKNPLLLKYPDIFVPVLGGAAFYRQGSDEFLDSLYRDDDMDPDISKRNKQYCEHAAIYWLYRHMDQFDNPDMIGLAHNRRFMDVDYENLDPDTVYLRRSIVTFPDNAVSVLNDFVKPHIAELLLDEYLHRLPQYKTAMDITFTQPVFYDKCMFIMNRDRFLKFIEYSKKIYDLVFDQEIKRQTQDWLKYQRDIWSYKWLYERSKAFFLEVMTAIYFTQMQLDGYHIVTAQPTKDSFSEY